GRTRSSSSSITSEARGGLRRFLYAPLASVYASCSAMSTLVHAALTVRTTARSDYRFVAAVALAGPCHLGVFTLPREALEPAHYAVALLIACIFGVRALARHKEAADSPAAATLDLELGVLLLAAAHAVVQVEGGLSSESYPLLYVLVAFLAAF